MNSKICFRTMHIFSDEIFFRVDRDSLSDHILKITNRKNCKIDILVRIRTLRVILNRKIKTALFEGGGFYMSITRTEPRCAILHSTLI